MCLSLCVYTWAPNVHVQSVMLYKLYICVCPYMISAWWIYDRAIRAHTHTLWGLAAGSGGQLNTSPWPCMAILGCVTFWIPSLCLIPTQHLQADVPAWTWPIPIPRDLLDARGWGFPQLLPKPALLLAGEWWWDCPWLWSPALLPQESIHGPQPQRAANLLWTLALGLSWKQ